MKNKPFVWKEEPLKDHITLRTPEMAVDKTVSQLFQIRGEPFEIRTQIAQLEALLKSLGLPETECPTVHQFADHAYAREVHIPKGILVIGKLHKQRHFNFISKGEVTFITEFDGLQRVKAPCMMVSEAGTKRVLYTHEETVWTVFHPLSWTPKDESELDKIEEEVIAKKYSQIGLKDPLIEEIREVGVLSPG